MKLDKAKELVERWTKEQVAANPLMTAQQIDDYAVMVAAKIRLRTAKQVSDLYNFAMSMKKSI